MLAGGRSKSRITTPNSILGLEDPANRLPLAVECTAPMAMFLVELYRLVVRRARPRARAREIIDTAAGQQSPK